MKILVVDVGGSHVKCAASGHKNPVKFKSGPKLTGLRKALLPDYGVLGGSKAEHLKRLPPQTRRGGNVDAFPGGFLLWERPARASARGNCR